MQKHLRRREHIKGGSEGANDLISFLEYYREAGAKVGG